MTRTVELWRLRFAATCAVAIVPGNRIARSRFTLISSVSRRAYQRGCPHHGAPASFIATATSARSAAQGTR